MTPAMQQAPIHNAQIVAASVYSHSGEFAPEDTDLRLPGRGLALEVTRSYRSSLADRIGELGRGWSSSIAMKLVPDGNDVLYHNGAGDVYRFVQRTETTFTAPAGFYGKLQGGTAKFVITQRFGRVFQFDLPE